MSRPSLFEQVDGVLVGPQKLIPSPRCWNPGLFRYAGRLWMSYRYHLNEPSGRCATAIQRLDEKTLQPVGRGRRVMFPNDNGSQHYEDARLFSFRGEPYMSVTEMTGYRPGVDYSCQIKYARLRLVGEKWTVREYLTPRHGNNDGSAKEKNWIFFEADRQLWFIYQDGGKHEVCRVEGEQVVETIETPAAVWPWGQVRGGSPPIELGGKLYCVFHSSIATEEPPHYVRYYAGVYEMEAKAPFRILRVSRGPLMCGSEADGHRVDPRYNAGWKPYVVFPGGIVQDGKRQLVSVGVNDWACAVVRLRLQDVEMGLSDGSDAKVRYFRRPNGTIPIRVVGQQQTAEYLNWRVPRGGPGCSVGAGYMELRNPMHAEEVASHRGVQEITAEEYLASARSASLVNQ